MEIQELYKIYLQQPDITTDTRNIKKGQLFFALKGENFNGNHYALKALEAGASFVVVDEIIDSQDHRIIKTDDVLLMLQHLAKHHREQFKIPFIAITGSNGKTTTKELVSKVLSSSYTTYSTYGNLNNHIGVPLTILKIPLDAEMAIIEMGANHQKEIASYCVYAKPSHGLITNCGKAHLEGFGGVEGVIKGKGELFEYLGLNDGVAFVNNSDEAIKNLSKKVENTFTYGTDGLVDGYALMTDSLLSVKFLNDPEWIIHTKMVGSYNLPNVLAAVAIGKFFNVPEDNIKHAIESYEPSNSRSQLVYKNGNEIILDAYNANPSSMRVAIQNFMQMEGTRKVLLLGSMMELGEESRAEHEAIITLLKTAVWEAVVLVGKQFNEIAHPFRGFEDAASAGEWFRSQDFKGVKILVKGSRSMKMEKVLE